MKYMIFMLLVFTLIFSVHADSNGVWTKAEDIRAGTFGSDETTSGNFSFDYLEINGNENVLDFIGTNHSYMNFYPQGKSSGREGWIGYGTSDSTELTLQDSSNLILNPYGGYVGVGTQSPVSTLDVDGDINANNLYSNGEVVATESWVLTKDVSKTNELQNLNEILSMGNNAGGKRIRNLGSPSSGSDAATKNYVDSNSGGETLDCYSRGGTMANSCSSGYEMTGAVDYDGTYDEGAYIFCCRIN